MDKRQSMLREEVALGRETCQYITSTSLLLFNITPCAYEVAKNLALLNVKTIGLCDDYTVQRSDLIYNYIFSNKNLDQQKTEVVKEWLGKFESTTAINTHLYDPNGMDTILKDYNTIIVFDIYNISLLRKIDDICQKNSKKLIYCGLIANFGFSFFNLEFIQMRERFQDTEPIRVKHITNSNPGEVVLQAPHSFLKGDFVYIEDVKGMSGIYPEEIRPIIDAKDDYSFFIEDTSNYTKYEEGGKVFGANMVRNMKYTNLQTQLDFPNFNSNNDVVKNFECHFMLIALLQIKDIENQFESFESQDFDVLYNRALKAMKNFTFYRLYNNKSEIDKLKQKLKTLLFSLENEQTSLVLSQLLANIVSHEVIKINGKFLPFRQTLYISPDFYVDNNCYNIFNKKLLIIGAGGKTHEFIKLLLIMTHKCDEELTVHIYDENVLNESALETNFFFDKGSIGMKKGKRLAQIINTRQNLLNLVSVEEISLFKTIKKCNTLLLTIDKFSRLYQYAEIGFDANKEIFMMNSYKGNIQCVKINEENIKELDQYFVNKVKFRDIRFEGLDIPQTADDCIKWASLLFETVFEMFIIDDVFLNDTNAQTPFYYLVLFLKNEIYKFLMFQAGKIENLVKLAILVFYIIFNWYIKTVKEWAQKENNRKQNHLWFNEVKSFNPYDSLHVDFALNFVVLFNQIYTKTLTTINRKQITDIIVATATKMDFTLYKFDLKEIVQDFKATVKDIKAVDEYPEFYNLKADLKYFDNVFDFAKTLIDLKTCIFELESASTCEFNNYFFSIVSTLTTFNSMNALAAFYKITNGDKDGSNREYINLNNTKIDKFI